MTSYQQRPGFGPGWFPDPMGRNDYRWWDGQTWSGAVVRGGTQGYDPLPTGPGGGRSGRRRRLVPVALVVVVALVAAAVVVVARDDGDDDAAGGASGGTTASGGSVTEEDVQAILAAELGEITAVDVPGDPADPLPLSLELTENELDVTRVDLYSTDDAPRRMELERGSDPPVTVAVDADGRIIVDDPLYAEVSIAFDGGTATLSWSTVDGEVGTTSLDIPADAQEQLEQAAEDVRDAQQDKRAATAGPLVTNQQQGTTHQFRLSGHTIGFGQVTPPEVEVRVVPDSAYCAAVPLAGSDAVAVTSASCRGSWTAPHMHLYFDAVVQTRLVSAAELTSEESQRLVAECSTRLQGWAPTIAFIALALGTLGTLLEIGAAAALAAVAAGIGFASTVGDHIANLLSPTGVPEQCARELHAHLLDAAARAFLEQAQVTVPYTVTIVDPTEDAEWDVANTSGPIVAQPWRRPTEVQGNPWPGAVGSGTFDITLGGALNLSTGDVQVTATWQGDTDIDVHVIDPSGEEIFFSHPGSASGGALDHDAIPGCGATAENAEHVVWAQGTAPRGQYQVFVDNYNSCTGSSQLVHLEVIVYGDRRISENLGPGPDQQSSTMTFSVP